MAVHPEKPKQSPFRGDMTAEKARALLTELDAKKFLDTRSLNGLVEHMCWHENHTIASMCQLYLDHRLSSELIRVPGIGARAMERITSFIAHLVDNGDEFPRISLQVLVNSQLVLRRHGKDYVLESGGVPYIRIVNGRHVFDGDGNYFKEAI